MNDRTWSGPPIDDHDLLAELPADLRELLEHENGWIAFGGALHLRGAVNEPEWHSLRWAMGFLGEHYNSFEPGDIPFAQDCIGDQFLLRDGIVHLLETEHDFLRTSERPLAKWLEDVESKPDGMIEIGAVHHLQEQGEKLEPGQLISVYPPFVMAESEEGVDLRAIDAIDRLNGLAQIAEGLR